VHWPSGKPEAQPTGPLPSVDIRCIQSVKIYAYPQSTRSDNRAFFDPRYLKLPPVLIVNRPTEGNITRTPLENIPTGAYRFIAMACDASDGNGTPAGQGIGRTAITADKTTTITLTTESAPGMTMSLWPKKITIGINEQLQFEIVMTNPDGRVVIYPGNTMTWTIADEKIATSVSYSGKVQAQGVGKTRVTATNPRTGKTASARIHVTSQANQQSDYSAQGPLAFLTADHDRVKPNQPVKLSWATYGATRVEADGFSIFPTDLKGIAAVRPTTTTTYSITASNAYGSVSSSITVYVE
ncbi:MAG TPA: hypothetical protein VGM23_11690, partial [Armatimonadota bacterium]